tara:strand:+ start:1086 stop:2423 length:1338 start_codon:yes stop_codon:yes gene_type:complete
MSLGTPQGRGIAAAAAAGSIARSAYQSYKRKRLMSSVKKATRRATRGKSTNKAVPIGQRVGPFLGSISATKPVKLVKGSTLYRSVHRQEMPTGSTDYAGGHSLWLGGSSLGTHTDNFNVVADALICHYLKRMKDHRSSRTQEPDANNWERIWQKAHISFGRVGSQSKSNYVAVVDNASINSLVPLVSAALEDRWVNHSEVPVKIVFEKEVQQAGTNYLTVVFRDDFMEKAIFTFSSKAIYKINNTTLAGDGAAGTNINAVDANPIDGRIYTFRNRVPIFSPSYLSNLESSIHTNLIQISSMEETDSGGTPIPQTAYGVQYNVLNKTSVPAELHAPVLRPAVVFNNCKTSTKVSFAPGGYKTFSMSYAHEGTLNSLFKHIMKQEYYSDSVQRICPPGADSFLICLKPTIRVSDNNNIALHTQAEYVFKCNMRPGKPAKLPTVQDIN